jgi:lysozyme family protein
MTSRFNKAIEHVFKHEGGFNDIKEDRGGATNWGISLVFLKSVGKDIDGDGDVDWLDIKKLTKDEAKELYYDNFWKPLYERLPERLAIKVFDLGVNAGNGASHKVLQRALNLLGSNLVTDGVIGQNTITEVGKYPEVQILYAFCKMQLDFYNKIVEKNPSQAKFIKGWTNRANWLP